MKRAFGIAIILAGVALAAEVAHLSVRIEEESTVDEAQPADAILVMGAAEYSGRPSPVLRARLDHALELYQRRLAPRIFTTGGAGGDAMFTEGGVGRSYLISKGVPAVAIVVETASDSTAYSTAIASEIMRRMGLHSAILVSDGYHIFRAKRMLKADGITAFGSPRKDAAPDSPHERWNCVKQAVGYLLWKAGVRI